jgi:hypothetical protein
MVGDRLKLSKDHYTKLASGNRTIKSFLFYSAQNRMSAITHRQKTLLTSKRCRIQKHALNSNSKPWSCYRIVMSDLVWSPDINISAGECREKKTSELD